MLTNLAVLHMTNTKQQKVTQEIQERFGNSNRARILHISCSNVKDVDYRALVCALRFSLANAKKKLHLI